MPEATGSTNSVERRTEPLTLSGKGIGRGRRVTPSGTTKNRALVPRRGILVAGKYRVATKPDNILLQKRYVNRKGKEAWTTIGYYLTLSSALRGLLHDEIRDTQLVDVKTVLDRIDQVERDILKLAAGR